MITAPVAIEVYGPTAAGYGRLQLSGDVAWWLAHLPTGAEVTYSDHSRQHPGQAAEVRRAVVAKHQADATGGVLRAVIMLREIPMSEHDACPVCEREFDELQEFLPPEQDQPPRREVRVGSRPCATVHADALGAAFGELRDKLDAAGPGEQSDDHVRIEVLGEFSVRLVAWRKTKKGPQSRIEAAEVGGR